MNAYACKVDDDLLLFTVFDTERGAKVNGLVRLFNVMPTDAWDDDLINSTWFDACAYGKQHTGKHVRVVPVIVSEDA